MDHRVEPDASAASEVEKQLSTQVHVLQEDFREKKSSTSQHIVRLESLQAEIKMLTDRKQELERRLSAMMEENNLLQGTVEELQDRVLILERQSHEKDMQRPEFLTILLHSHLAIPCISCSLCKASLLGIWCDLGLDAGPAERTFNGQFGVTVI
ncbi:UNVERIFIED_CONTAM: hypothetical protein K2H54_025775 [Gekko kuhli]